MTRNEEFDNVDVVQDISAQGEITEAGDRVVRTDDADGYVIQKDGTDGVGIINFKTQ